MRNKTQRIPTRFAPETRFALDPRPGPVPRAAVAEQCGRLRERILNGLLAGAPGETLQLYLRRAVQEAEALAWTTPFPLLLFPVLAEEKAHLARRQAGRQEEIRQRSLNLMADAA
jgi:hypothetical protein